MKKILTVSLFAIMAVSAANADIASTKYVDDAKTAAISSANEYTDTVFGSTGDDVSTLLSTVDGLQSSIDTISGTITTMDTAYKAADTALDGRVDTLEADNTTNKSNISTLQSDVAGLKSGENSVAKQIETALTDYSTTEEMNTAIANEAVNTVVAGTANGTILVDNQAVSITGLKSAAFTESDAYDAAGSAAAAQSAAEAKVTALANGAVKTNTEAIAEINDSAVMKSGVDSDVVAKANSAMQETALKGLATWTSQGCATGTCSLVSKNGSIAWEKVSY